MKQIYNFIIFVIALSITSEMNAQTYLLKDNGSGGSATSSSAYEDANGQIGIGTTTPNAVLGVYGSCALSGNANPLILAEHFDCSTANSSPDYFVAKRTGIDQYFNPIVTTDFVIKSKGNIGVGIPDPQAPLHIRARDWWNGSSSGLPGTPSWMVTDDNGEFVAALLNTGSGTPNEGGGNLIIRGRDNHDATAFAVLNTSQERLAFAVTGDGTAAMGFDISSNPGTQPIAQLDIRKFNPYSYLVNVSDLNNSQRYFNINNNGTVGVGIAPSFGTLAIKGPSTNGTTLDLYRSSAIGWDNQIRFLNHTATAIRHAIVDDATSNNLVIAPGVNGAANAMLQINGKVKIGNVNTPGNYFLYVDSGIMTEKVKVAVKSTADWSDFVFDENYKLPTFDELNCYIEENKRLPDIPSAEEVVKNGVDVAAMDAKLLQKIEELTLYVIQLRKQNEEQQKLLDGLVQWIKK